MLFTRNTINPISRSGSGEQTNPVHFLAGVPFLDGVCPDGEVPSCCGGGFGDVAKSDVTVCGHRNCKQRPVSNCYTCGSSRTNRPRKQGAIAGTGWNKNTLKGSHWFPLIFRGNIYTKIWFEVEFSLFGEFSCMTDSLFELIEVHFHITFTPN